MCAVAITQDK